MLIERTALADVKTWWSARLDVHSLRPQIYLHGAAPRAQLTRGSDGGPLRLTNAQARCRRWTIRLARALSNARQIGGYAASLTWREIAGARTDVLKHQLLACHRSPPAITGGLENSRPDSTKPAEIHRISSCLSRFAQPAPRTRLGPPRPIWSPGEHTICGTVSRTLLRAVLRSALVRRIAAKDAY